ncbi:hypothetical protein [Promicromonospora aerolata]|uniref:Uncharacterized protein n=1 Tax=Promicromonospora aerolata TaxID=195749 RepID=A0ABW4UZW8_9MICO
MPANVKSLKIVRDFKEPVQVTFDSAPARCKALDEKAYDLLAGRLGPQGLRQYARAHGGMMSFFEADWVATQTCLWYINYNAGLSQMMEWYWVSGAEIVKRRFGGTADVRIESTRQNGIVWIVNTGRPAAESLVKLARGFAGSQDGRFDVKASE